MPTNRRKRSIGRRTSSGSELSRAVQELIVTGHWWRFLAGPEESQPSQDQLCDLYKRYRSRILERQPNCWAHRYFEGDYIEWLELQKNRCENEQDEAALAAGCYFDAHAANRVVCLFERFLRCSDGPTAGQLIVLHDWQRKKFIEPLYGWKRANGLRRFRRFLLIIPKKNSKSFMCSGLTVYHMEGDNEPAAQVVSAANDRDQAAIIFHEAKNMVMSSPELSYIRAVPTKKQLWGDATGSFYEAMSSDAPSSEGIKPCAVFVDEVHAFKKDDLIRSLQYAGAARQQPMQGTISTVGEEFKGVWWEMVKYALKVKKAEVEDTAYFQLMYMPDFDELKIKPDLWKDEKFWFDMNPSLGQSLPLDNFKDDFRMACESVSEAMNFRRYRLNIPGEKMARWLSLDRWAACGDSLFSQLDSRVIGTPPRPVLNPALQGRDCYAGVDLASRTDLASLALVFPLDDGTHATLVYAFAPENGARDREKIDGVPYLRWAEDGWLILTPGTVTDYEFIFEFILTLAKYYNICEIGFDRFNATMLQAKLDGEGFECVEVGQGFVSLSAPAKEFEARVIAGTFAHGDHPVLNWQAGNVVVRVDAAGNIKPDKEKSSERIDCIVSIIIAEFLVLKNMGNNRRSRYEDADAELIEI